MKIPKCFSCEEEIECAVVSDDEEDYWNFPQGVIVRGGGNFGSSVLDSLVDGIMVEFIICDACLLMKEDITRRVKLKSITQRVLVDKKGKVIKILE